VLLPQCRSGAHTATDLKSPDPPGCMSVSETTACPIAAPSLQADRQRRLWPGSGVARAFHDDRAGPTGYGRKKEPPPTPHGGRLRVSRPLYGLCYSAGASVPARPTELSRKSKPANISGAVQARPFNLSQRNKYMRVRERTAKKLVNNNLLSIESTTTC